MTAVHNHIYANARESWEEDVVLFTPTFYQVTTIVSPTTMGSLENLKLLNNIQEKLEIFLEHVVGNFRALLAPIQKSINLLQTIANMVFFKTNSIYYSTISISLSLSKYDMLDLFLVHITTNFMPVNHLLL